MISLGIDIGSTTTKGVLLDREYNILQNYLVQTRSTPKASARKVIEELSKDITPELIYATGYGRALTDKADKKITEITCHGAGAKALNPHISAVIDIGGQDSKAILLDKNGKVLDFAMNDKCAAGTGSFLDSIAHKFDIRYELMLDMIKESTKAAKINSTCVVFAESEIIGLLSTDESMANILNGVLRAIASRINRLYNQIKAPKSVSVLFTGGVARNKAMSKILCEELKINLITSPYSQFMGAIGAAVLAQKDFL